MRLQRHCVSVERSFYLKILSPRFVEEKKNLIRFIWMLLQRYSMIPRGGVFVIYIFNDFTNAYYAIFSPYSCTAPIKTRTPWTRKFKANTKVFEILSLLVAFHRARYLRFRAIYWRPYILVIVNSVELRIPFHVSLHSHFKIFKFYVAKELRRHCRHNFSAGRAA